MGTAKRSFFAPLRLASEYRTARRNYAGPGALDEFDLAHGVETSTRVDRSDLRVNSSNWISAAGYWPSRTDLFIESLCMLKIAHENFVFVDFGSGKGRVLLLA